MEFLSIGIVEIALIILVGWVIPGIFTVGMMVAYFQKKYPLIAQEEYGRDLRDGIFTAFWGIYGLTATIYFTWGAGYGMQWRRK